MERARLETELVRHHEAAWGWALSCCVWDRGSAEDVLQEAYLRVLVGRACFEGRSPFRTWLFGVIRLVALEHRRAGSRRSERVRGLVEADGPELADDPASGPYERLETAERTRILREGLERLPERQREILHLVFYQGMTIADAAEVMGVRVGTARTHYARGKRTLRAELSALWEA